MSDVNDTVPGHSGGAVRVGRVPRVLMVMGAALLLSTGCYRFTPVEPAAVPAGARVRAQVTAAAAERLGEASRSRSAPRLEGRLLQVLPDGGLLLEVPRRSLEVPVGVSSRPLFSRVNLERGEVAGLELKRLDRGRTALFVAGTGLGAGLLVKLAFETVGRNSEGGGIPVNEIVVPLFSTGW